MTDVVVDASAMVDILVDTPVGQAVAKRLRGQIMHAPAHFDAEVLSALGRLHRANSLSARQAAVRLQRLKAAPVRRHALPELLDGAWLKRQNLRLVDALYAQLADQLGSVALITTDSRLATAASSGELIESP